MATKKPLKITSGKRARFVTGDTIGVDNGGTNLSTIAANSLLGALTLDTYSAISLPLSKAYGGTGVDLSATGGATNVLAQAAGGVISSRALIAADIPNLPASILTSSTVATARLGSGTADNTTFLRGDGTWAAPSAGSVSLSSITAGTLGVTLALGTNAVTGTYLQAGGSGYSILRAGTTGTVLQNAGGTVNWLVWTDSTNTMAIGTGTAGQAQLTCSPTNFSARSGSTYLALTNAAGSINSLLWTDASSTWALDSTCTLNIAGNLAFTGAGKLLAPTSSPTSSGTGTTGQITWDSSYIYVCTSSNTWKRAALTGGY